MNNDYGGNRRLPRAGILRAGILPAIVALAVLATACGGSAGSAAGGSANYQQALAYSECMRAHGVPDFPDPNAQGQIIQSAHPGQKADANGSVAQAADNTCRHLLPGGGTNSNTAGFQREVQQDLKIAQCMRAMACLTTPTPRCPPGSSI